MLYDAGLGGGLGPRELDILSCAAHTGGCPVRIAGAWAFASPYIPITLSRP
jgi:hypothetical protein